MANRTHLRSELQLTEFMGQLRVKNTVWPTYISSLAHAREGETRSWVEQVTMTRHIALASDGSTYPLAQTTDSGRHDARSIPLWGLAIAA